MWPGAIFGGIVFIYGAGRREQGGANVLEDDTGWGGRVLGEI